MVPDSTALIRAATLMRPAAGWQRISNRTGGGGGGGGGDSGSVTFSSGGGGGGGGDPPAGARRLSVLASFAVSRNSRGNTVMGVKKQESLMQRAPSRRRGASGRFLPQISLNRMQARFVNALQVSCFLLDDNECK